MNDLKNLAKLTSGDCVSLLILGQIRAVGTTSCQVDQGHKGRSAFGRRGARCVRENTGQEKKPLLSETPLAAPSPERPRVLSPLPQAGSRCQSLN